MTANPQETTAYVTHDDLSVLRQDVSMRLEEIQRQLQATLTQTRADNLEQAARLVDEKLQHEREQRKNEIADLRQEIKAMGRETRNALSEIDTKLDETMKGISTISGAMQGIQDAFKVRDERSLEVTRRLDDRIDEQALSVKTLYTDVTLLTATQADALVSIRQLTNTIHGNPNNKDDAPSLFAVLRDLKGQVEAGFSTVTTNHLALQTSMESNAQAITALRQERERDKAIWAQRLKLLTGAGHFAKKILESRLGVAVVTALGGAIIVALFPELRTLIVNILQSGLNNPSGG